MAQQGKPHGMDETDYLLSSPANALRLREAIAELEHGGGLKCQFVESGTPGEPDQWVISRNRA